MIIIILSQILLIIGAFSLGRAFELKRTRMELAELLDEMDDYFNGNKK